MRVNERVHAAVSEQQQHAHYDGTYKGVEIPRSHYYMPAAGAHGYLALVTVQ